MDPARIAELLQPFLDDSGRSGRSEESAILDQTQLRYISTYIDILLRWNARINLTAIRQPEEIVTRHFGESLFAARHLFPAKQGRRERPRSCSVIDVGSGAGFPGLPIKVWATHIHLTLIESNQKKATFLREVARGLTLTDINIFSGRAEDFPDPVAEVVTLRAVERFNAVLPVAASLVAPGGRLALLISQAQLTSVHELALSFTWKPAIPIPLSATRILAIATRES